MIYLNTRFQRKCLLKKQGIRQTQKLRQYTNQSCKKTFFVRYPDIQLKNVRILYLLNFVIL